MDMVNRRKERVVLVDDDPHVLNALRFAFETEGYEVLALRSGEELLKATLPTSNTCIVIDHRLGGLSGLQTVEKLRQRGVRAPAILVTTNPSPHLMRQAARAGIDVVEKPLLTDALAQRVSAALINSSD